MVNNWFQENLQDSGFSWLGPYHEVVTCQKTPILYGFSPSLLPKPKDWGDSVHVTGTWFLNAPTDWNPPPKLLEFLAALYGLIIETAETLLISLHSSN